MKKFALVIPALLISFAAFSQKVTHLGGRITHAGNRPLAVLTTFERFVTHTDVKISADGTFHLTIPQKKTPTGLQTPWKVTLIAGRESIDLFWAEGYDVQLTADVQDHDTFIRTARLTGKGAALNRYWRELQPAGGYPYKDSVNWNAEPENEYLRHFKDSVETASSWIRMLEKVDDPNSGHFREILLNDLNGRSARSLYAYSYYHQYSYEQTQSLLKKAALPDARKFAHQWEYFSTVWIDKPHYEYLDTVGMRKRRDEVYALQKDRFTVEGMIGVRFGQQIRADASVHPGAGQPIQQVRGKRIFGDAYEGLTLHNAFGGSTPTMIITAPIPVELAIQGVNPANAHQYRYRIVQNSVNELVPWTTPAIFRTTSYGKTTYAWLGSFDYKNEQVLTLEIEEKNSHKRQILLIDWRAVKKPGIDFTAEISKSNRGVILYSVGLGEGIDIFSPEFIVSAAPDIRFRLSDSLQNLSFRLQTNPETYEYYIALKRTIDGKTDVIDLGKTNTRLVLQKLFWDRPGVYEITFTPRLFNWGGSPHRDFKELSETIKFTVMPPLNAPRVFTARQLSLIVAITVFIALCIIAYFRIRHSLRETKTKREKEMATLRLRTVRSQLNPHFMFNALAGIQNLMNRNDPDKANLYLSKFARLTRYVLDENEKDLVSISAEISLLEDYLQMEQMRFGFNYSFEIDETVDKDNTEIPAMLLQPFVENAVKHGVSGSNEKGVILIRFARQKNNLVLQVRDNGKGYDQESASKGKGIALSKNRILLFNQIYGENTIGFDIIADKGTTVTITLKDWI